MVKYGGIIFLKRKISVMMSFIILMFLFASCSPKNDNSIVSSNSSVENKENYPHIIIQSPMTLSSNDLFHINGEHQYLRLKMVEGKYYEDWTPGAYMGTIWEGCFIIELADESGNVISQTDLNKIYKDPLIFNSSFQIEFDDYNNDGDFDFTIGQYASSNGRNYKLFTLRKNGEIGELAIKGYSSLLISNTTGYYSTKLTKVDNVTFKTEYYNNSEGKSCEDVFKWDGKEFIKVENHEAI